jgi:hypothetical protein
LLRKAADQAGRSAGLSAAMRVKGSSPLLDRGIVLASMAVAIALGATSVSDIALLEHLAPLLGSAPGGPAVRRALDLAEDKRIRDRIARARARARAHSRWWPDLLQRRQRRNARSLSVWGPLCSLNDPFVDAASGGFPSD